MACPKFSKSNTTAGLESVDDASLDAWPKVDTYIDGQLTKSSTNGAIVSPRAATKSPRSPRLGETRKTGRRGSRGKSRRSITETLVLDQPEENGTVEEKPLVELVTEKLLTKVSWLTRAVKALNGTLIDLQSQVDTDFEDIRIEQMRSDVDISQLRQGLHAVEADVRHVQFAAPAGVTAGSGEEIGAPSPDAQAQNGQAVSASLVSGLAIRVDNLSRDFQRLDSSMQHAAQQQEQKDISQDELLTMELDALKREISSCVRQSGLEEQRKVMLGKIQHMEQELKEMVTGQNAELKEMAIADSRKAQDQLKSISEAISMQMKLLEDKISENNTSDDARAREIDARMLAIEKSVEEVKSGGHAPLQAHIPMMTPGEGEASFESHENRIRDLEIRINSGTSTMEMATNTSPKHADQNLTLLVQGLSKRLDTLEKSSSDALTSSTYLTQVPDDTDGDTGKRMGKVENKINQLESSVRDDKKRLQEVQASIKSVETKMAKLNPNEKTSQNLHENPLSWLEEKVNEIANRENRREKGELPKRVGLLEIHQRDFDYRLNTVRGELGDEIEAQLEKVALRIREQQQESRGLDASFGQGEGDVVKSAGHGKVGGMSDEVWEEIQRLRCMLECIESAVPLNTRKAMEFFKRPPGSASQNSSVLVELEEKVTKLSLELDKKTTAYHAGMSGEMSNVLRIVKGMEKENEMLSSKIQDLCDIQPKVVNALEIVDAFLSKQAEETTGESGKPGQHPNGEIVRSRNFLEEAEMVRDQIQMTTGAMRKAESVPGLNSRGFKDSLTQEVREDFDQGLGRLRAEFSSALCAKADASDVASLFGMVEAIYSTPGHSRPQTTDQFSRVPSRTSSRGSMRPPAGQASQKKGSRASTPLGPNPGQRGTAWDGDRPGGLLGHGQSQSTGKLPTLSR